MAGGGEREFARGRAVEQPGFEYAVLDQREPPRGDAFAVERTRAQPALAQRIVDDGDAVCEDLLSHFVAQEAGLARNRGAVRGAGEMRNNGARDARVEYHRHLAGRDLARVEACDRALAGAAAD